MDDLTRLINESGMDQAGWDELFGLADQAGQANQGGLQGIDMQGEGQLGTGMAVGDGGNDWGLWA
jgi:hypothetical protein